MRLLGKLANEGSRDAPGDIDAELVHDLYDLGVKMLRRGGASGQGPVSLLGRSVEQGLAHLRPSGVLAAHEEDCAHDG